MLFGYPLEATEDNWLHDCLCEVIRSIHGLIDSKTPLPDWPDIIPEPHRDKFRRRTSIRDKFVNYHSKASRLKKTNRDKVIEALLDQNNLEDLLEKNCDCTTIEELSKLIRKPLQDIFAIAFTLLTDFEVRDKHYQIIHEAISDKVCPFCGCERLDAPGAPREDYDHYLDRKRYPFAAANLKNLIPMGSKCNEQKGTGNILLNDFHERRKAINPYQNTMEFNLKLNSTKVQLTPGANPPFNFLWEIDFNVNAEELETWDSLFDIKARYKRDNLQTDFKNWIRLFSGWCIREGLQVKTDAEVSELIERYNATFYEQGFEDRAFLKAAFFEMLNQRCKEGDKTILNYLREASGLHIVS